MGRKNYEALDELNKDQKEFNKSKSEETKKQVWQDVPK